MKTTTVLLAFMLFLLLSAVSVSAVDNKLYADKCASCHFGDGTGNKKLGVLVGGDLSKLDLTKITTAKKSDGELKEIILNGMEKMPAWKGKFSETEAMELVKFLRTLQKK
ncbi:MAG: cytochrome c [Parcubacteria group bacterium]|nr:cytochrome c [Parcubacteria group bacterium]